MERGARLLDVPLSLLVITTVHIQVTCHLSPLVNLNNTACSVKCFKKAENKSVGKYCTSFYT
jgi:hypothetical protein